MTKYKNEINQSDETRTHILEAAAQLFTRDGYARTTTRALAISANVNEVTLFRLFENKEKIFAAVIEKYGGPSIGNDLETHFTGDYRKDLLNFGRTIMHLLIERRDFIRMMLCEANHFPEMASVLESNPIALRKTLANYLERQLQSGKYRQFNPDAAAQAFLGMFITYGLILDPERATIAGMQDMDDVISQYVDIFINGTIHQER